MSVEGYCLPKCAGRVSAYTWLLLAEIRKLEQVKTFVECHSLLGDQSEMLKELIEDLKSHVGDCVYQAFIEEEDKEDDSEDEDEDDDNTCDDVNCYCRLIP